MLSDDDAETRMDLGRTYYAQGTWQDAKATRKKEAQAAFQNAAAAFYQVIRRAEPGTSLHRPGNSSAEAAAGLDLDKPSSKTEFLDLAGLRLCREAILLEEDDAVNHRTLGIVLAVSDNLNGAALSLDDAVKIDRDDSDTLAARGYVRLNQVYQSAGWRPTVAGSPAAISLRNPDSLKSTELEQVQKALDESIADFDKAITLRRRTGPGLRVPRQRPFASG